MTTTRSAVLAFDAAPAAAACRGTTEDEAPVKLNLSVYREFDAVAGQWRRFERVADCLPFQTFDWLLTWQRRVGAPDGVRPAIVVATFADGETALILPLAVEAKRAVRRLCWLGQDLNDYNAPLLAPHFWQRVTAEDFIAAWRELRVRLQREPALRHDWIELEKMPQLIGGQLNPFCRLAAVANPSGAHATRLGDDWKNFYAEKRSSATRRHDRAKRNHLSEFGAISFVTSTDADDARQTLQILMQQKSRLLAHKGIADLFARPGWREFFFDAIGAPAMRHLLHVSRVQIGPVCAAANLGVVFRDTYYHMLASYDDGEVSRFGPGALHLRELLAYAIGAGLRRFDFTVGDEPFKLEWSDCHVKLWDYATAATWRGWPAFLRSAALRRVKRFIKQTPWAWRMVSKLRSLFGRRAALPAPSATARESRISPSS